MTFRLHEGEPIGPALKRVLLAEIAAARREVGDLAGDRAPAVHRARRHLKRARSLLRVFRPVIGDAYAVRKDRLGRAADLLAAARDADAAVSTARRLARDDAEAAAALVERLQRDAASAHARETDVAAVAAELRRAEAEAASLPLVADGAGLLTGELADAYRRGRRDWREAGEGAGEETLHDWRKRVKHRWHLTVLVGPRTEATSKAVAEDLDRLAEWLGDERDLALLALRLKDDPDAAGGKKAARRLIETAEHRCRKLTRRALELGGELFAAKTRHFEAEIREALAPPPKS